MAKKSKSVARPDRSKPKSKTPAKGKGKAVPVAKEPRDRKELRNGIRYKLPLGCKFNEVEKSIRDYSVFEFERRVYALRTIPADPELKMPTRKHAYPVSNFTCRINSHIIHAGGAIKLITIINEFKEEHTYHVPGADLLNLPTFRKVTAGDKGNFDWSGTEIDYRNYLRYMQDHMGKGRLIRELGWQPEGMFVFTNMALNGTQMPIDRHGCFDHNGERFYVPSGNQMELMDRGKFVNARRVEFIRSEVTFEALSKQLRIVHREHSMMPLVFALATAFRDHIFHRLKGFPIMFLYGESGSGKDQCIMACQSLFGTPQPALALSGDNTGPGSVNMFAEFINLPLCLSEYLNTIKRERLEMIAGLWDGRGRRRGTKNTDTSNYTTDSVPIDCSAYVTGNDYPNILDKLMTRMLIEEMNKDTFTAEERKPYDVLNTMMTDGYSHLLAPIIACRDEVERTWYQDHYKNAQTLIDGALGDKSIHGRMQSNMATLLATFLLFEKRLPFAFTRGEFIAHMVKSILVQNTKRSQGNEVANFWSCFIAATRKRRLVEGTHYRIDGNEIGFYWSEVHSVYLETHRELFQEPGMNISTMKGKLQHHPCWMQPLASLRIGNRRNSAFLFDMTKVGTHLAGLLRHETEEESRNVPERVEEVEMA